MIISWPDVTPQPSPNPALLVTSWPRRLPCSCGGCCCPPPLYSLSFSTMQKAAPVLRWSMAWARCCWTNKLVVPVPVVCGYIGPRLACQVTRYWYPGLPVCTRSCGARKWSLTWTSWWWTTTVWFLTKCSSMIKAWFAGAIVVMNLEPAMEWRWAT